MLWFGDRYKDVIKTGGENVASLEVEKLVYEVAPSVAQAVVIGLPHDRWGEAITVVAVAHPGRRSSPRPSSRRSRRACRPSRCRSRSS